MSRSRNIKPGFFKNEVLVELPFEYRLLFIGLWSMADREGRLEDRPTRIRMELFPADAVDVEAGLRGLGDRGFIQRYTVDDRRYIQVLAWAKHQNPHVKEAKSTIPPPERHGTCTVVAPDKPAASRADSLIPDSLIPEEEHEPIGSSASADADAPKKRSDPIPYQAIVDTYNLTMTGLPKARDLTKGRRALIRSAWNGSPQRQSLAFWHAYFGECQASNNLNGTGPYAPPYQEWRPDFEHLLKAKTVTRVFEAAMDRRDRDIQLEAHA